jgi:hypothetical protein
VSNALQCLLYKSFEYEKKLVKCLTGLLASQL